MKRQYIFFSHKVNDDSHARSKRALEEGFRFFMYNGHIYFVDAKLGHADTGLTIDEVIN